MLVFAFPLCRGHCISRPQSILIQCDAMRTKVFALVSGDGERNTSRMNLQRGALLPPGHSIDMGGVEGHSDIWPGSGRD
jgi:hypothetical protein